MTRRDTAGADDEEVVGSNGLILNEMTDRKDWGKAQIQEARAMKYIVG